MSEQVNEVRLQALCAEWQELLRLQDWEIVVRFAHAREFGNVHAVGHVSPCPTMKRAIIRLLRHEDLDRSIPDQGLHWTVFDDPIEVNLVHELLHLHFHADDRQASDAEEVGVHVLSTLLVKWRRRIAEVKVEKKTEADE